MATSFIANNIRLVFAGLIAVSLLLGGQAIAAPSSPELLIDVTTGAVILEDEATRPWFPASTTKLMTAYVALRAIKNGRIKLESPLVASARAASQPPSKIGIRPGQEITLDNALKILMVKSANDLAVVIAEGIGGSVDGFAQLMNAEAARLGMRESSFVNPHGLFDTRQVSSARDLALLGRALLLDFPEYRDYWGIGAVQLGTRVMKNTNGLIGRYPGAEGMKTGFVCASGFNVVALANRGGRTLMAVVLGAGGGAERTVRTAQLFDKGFGGSAWGASGGLLTSLAASPHGAAPNMRQEICRKGRQIPLGEEEDNNAAISYTSAGGDNSSVYAIGVPSPVSGAASSVGGKGASGRAVLGPRADLPPTPVFLGRMPGSTEVARGAGKGAVLPASATAFAPTNPGAIPLRETRNKTEALEGRSSAAVPGAPLQLPGVITTAGPGAAGPGAIGLRSIPGGRDAPRPVNAGAIAPRAAPVATRAGNEKDAASKSAASGAPATVVPAKAATPKIPVAKAAATPQAAKAKASSAAPPVAQPKAGSKKKPAEADDE